MAGGKGGLIVSRRFAVVHESRADFQIATELADRVLLESIKWMGAEDLEYQRVWLCDIDGTPLKWKSIKKAALDVGIGASVILSWLSWTCLLSRCSRVENPMRPWPSQVMACPRILTLFLIETSNQKSPLAAIRRSIPPPTRDNRHADKPISEPKLLCLIGLAA